MTNEPMNTIYENFVGVKIPKKCVVGNHIIQSDMSDGVVDVYLMGNYPMCLAHYEQAKSDIESIDSGLAGFLYMDTDYDPRQVF